MTFRRGPPTLVFRVRDGCGEAEWERMAQRRVPNNQSQFTVLSGRVVDQLHERSSARQGRDARVRVVLLAILVLNLAVAIAKITLGVVTGSLAISADGVQSLLDAFGNVVGLVGIYVASRPPDPNHAYGHHRYETLTSLAIAGLMLLVLFGLVQGAWTRLQTGAAPVITGISFFVMLATLVVNVGVTVWERREGRRLRSSLLLADAKNTASNIVVSIAVIGSLVAVTFGATWADAAITLIVAGVIAWGAWTIVRDATLVLSDAAVGAPEAIARVVRAVPGVEGTHNIRSRGGEGRVWVDLHIQVDPALAVTTAHDIASEVARVVEEEIGDPADVTVHIEPADESHLRERRGYQPLP